MLVIFVSALLLFLIAALEVDIAGNSCAQVSTIAGMIAA